MDFVVLGFGIGALAVLLGLTARDLGPFARRIPRDGSLPWAEVAQRAAWGRACRAGGLVLSLAGGILCLVTGITLLLQASDSAGMRVVVIGVTIAVLGLAAWGVLYVMRPSFLANANLSARAPKRSSQQMSRRGPVARSRQDRGRRINPETVDPPAGRRSRPDDRRSPDPRQPRGEPNREPVDPHSPPPEGPRLGALTVDAMGSLRRASLSSTDYNDHEDFPQPAADPEPPAPRRTRNDQADRSQRRGRDRRSS